MDTLLIEANEFLEDGIRIVCEDVLHNEYGFDAEDLANTQRVNDTIKEIKKDGNTQALMNMLNMFILAVSTGACVKFGPISLGIGSAISSLMFIFGKLEEDKRKTKIENLRRYIDDRVDVLDKKIMSQDSSVRDKKNLILLRDHLQEEASKLH